MAELTIYLDKTTKTQFNDWLFVYGNNKRNKTYLFDKTRFYSLSFPINKLDNLNQMSLDAIVTEPISLVKVNEDKDIYSYNDFEQKDVIKITWLEIGERLKVTVSHISVLRLLQPILELLSAIAQDWQGTRRDVLEYAQAQATRHGVTIDTSHFAVDLDAAQPVNIIAYNQGGTITYKGNEQGQTIITGGTINLGYKAEIGQGIAIKPEHIRLNHTSGNFQPGLYPPQAKDAIIRVASETLAGLTENAATQAAKGGAELPTIEDPTDLRIWKLIEEDPSITDTQIAQQLGHMTRQTVNTRRRTLQKMGYSVRKVSRQNR